MGKAISRDLRERILAAYDNGEGTQEDLAARFVVSQSFISRFLKRHREGGSLDPTPPPGRPSKIPQAEPFEELVNMHADATLEELAALYTQEIGSPVSHMTIQRGLRRFGLTRKKKSV